MTSFQSQLTSFQRNFSDDEQEGLVDTTMGDDDVLLSSETPSIVESKNEAKSRFFLRIWSWIQSKYKHVSYRPASRSRKRSVEFHTKRIFNTKMTSNGCNRKQEQITLVSQRQVTFLKVYVEVKGYSYRINGDELHQRKRKSH